MSHCRTPGSGSFWILAGAIWSAPPTAALWLSAEPVARADIPFQLSVAKRAKAAALPPHSKSPTVSGPSYRTPQNEPLPEIGVGFMELKNRYRGSMLSLAAGDAVGPSLRFRGL